MTDFYIGTFLLSSLYRDLYNDLIESGNAYIQTIHTADVELPLDGFYKVASVTTESGAEITRANLRGNNRNGYYVENDILYMPAGPKIVKLCPLPATLTVADDYKEVTFENTEDIPQPFTNPSLNEDGEIDGAEPLFWQGINIDFSNLPDFLNKDDVTIVNVNVSDPYIYVSYSDGSIRLFTSEDEYVDVNPFNDKNRTFKGMILAFTADDTTGKGILFHDEVKDKYYYGSFVPNTELSYPENVFFELLIYRLAAILSSLQGLTNPYLTNVLLPTAENNFQIMLSKGSQGTRFTNVGCSNGVYR